MRLGKRHAGDELHEIRGVEVEGFLWVLQGCFEECLTCDVVIAAIVEEGFAEGEDVEEGRHGDDDAILVGFIASVEPFLPGDPFGVDGDGLLDDVCGVFGMRGEIEVDAEQEFGVVECLWLWDDDTAVWGHACVDGAHQSPWVRVGEGFVAARARLRESVWVGAEHGFDDGFLG